MADTIEIIQGTATVVEVAGPTGPQGPPGPQGDPGEASGSIAWDNVTDKPASFTPSSHTHVAADITDFTSAVEAVSPPADWDTLANKPATFAPSLHGSSHHTGGADQLAAHQINGQTIFGLSVATYSSDQTIPSYRARIFTASNTNAGGISITLPTGAGGTLIGDTIVIVGGNTMAGPITVRRVISTSPLTYETLATIAATGEQYRFRASGGTTGGWSLVPVDTHTHTLSEITDAGTAAASDTGDFAAASHTHGNLTNDGKIGSTSGLPLKTGTSGVVEAGAFGTGAGEFCEGDDARLSDDRNPLSHAASHAAAGSDPVFDQDLNTTDDVQFDDLTVASISADEMTFTGEAGIGFTSEDGKGNTRANLGLGTAAVEDTTAFAAPSDIPDPSSTTPQPLGTAAAGTSDDYSRADHIHGAPALNDLSNVSAATPSDNDVLTYDNATSTWVAEAPAAGGGSSIMQSIAVGFVLN